MTNNASDNASDIANDRLIIRISPAWIRPYLRLARLDRPIGTWLLLFPCWWSMLLATSAPGYQIGSPFAPLYFMALFAIGALTMRGAGCTINDMADREYDKKVARTATRPLASGELSMRQAVAFLALQLTIGLAVLSQFNTYTIILAASAILLVICYPFMKRITYWPQAWLGLTFNWGALVGWAAVRGDLSLPPLLIYIGGIAWTLGYDTIYAHQDKEDDALVGVKSTALKLGNKTKHWLVLFYSICTLCFAAAGFIMGLQWPFWLGIAGLASHFFWQVTTVQIDDPADCLNKFKSNRNIGWIFLAGIYLAATIK
ncbi:4-hydroxybenzoate octaprenyltransferase [uncultured Kiloniella sp.]|uniref:4-hydroxybenzoate octaprenyltransferase n=1 Tax=uncultured Kiloniella sp. TaxID=1133091 RepID=UPI0026285850|nr:4-hydroxybenzoate octaprenyltransferase [uncultured Kiloniella sp.]